MTKPAKFFTYSNSPLLLVPTPTAPTLSKAAPSAIPIDWQKRIDYLKTSLNLLERWEFSHYRENGFLAWIAKLILRIFPSSKARLDKIEVLEACLTEEGLQKNSAPQIEIKGKPVEIVRAPTTPIRRPAASLFEVTDPETFLTSITQQGLSLKSASSLLRSDKKVVLAAVTHYGKDLQYADIKLQADREVVIAAIAQNALALQFAGPELQADREVALKAVKQKGWALKYVSPRLQSDREIITAAVAQNGLALQFAHSMFLADKEIALIAVKQRGPAIHLISPKLQSDKEILLAAAPQKTKSTQSIKKPTVNSSPKKLSAH